MQHFNLNLNTIAKPIIAIRVYSVQFMLNAFMILMKGLILCLIPYVYFRF